MLNLPLIQVDSVFNGGCCGELYIARGVPNYQGNEAAGRCGSVQILHEEIAYTMVHKDGFRVAWYLEFVLPQFQRRRCCVSMYSDALALTLPAVAVVLTAKTPRWLCLSWLQVPDLMFYRHTEEEQKNAASEDKSRGFPSVG